MGAAASFFLVFITAGLDSWVLTGVLIGIALVLMVFVAICDHFRIWR